MFIPKGENRISLKEFVRTGQILFSALIIGQILFLLVAVYMVQFMDVKFETNGLDKPFMYAAIVIAIVCVVSGFIFYKNRLNAIKDKDNLFEKLAEYRSTQIIRWALLEGPSFFGIVVFILTSNYLFLSIVGIIIGIFVLTMPSRSKLESELELSWDEKNQLSD